MRKKHLGREMGMKAHELLDMTIHNPALGHFFLNATFLVEHEVVDAFKARRCNKIVPEWGYRVSPDPRARSYELYVRNVDLSHFRRPIPSLREIAERMTPPKPDEERAMKPDPATIALVQVILAVLDEREVNALRFAEELTPAERNNLARLGWRLRSLFGEPIVPSWEDVIRRASAPPSDTEE